MTELWEMAASDLAELVRGLPRRTPICTRPAFAVGADLAAWLADWPASIG
ncbi:hypothetical protein [Microbispora catharanthi]|nr:hypothetical protein [Microbispora catharanthi]